MENLAPAEITYLRYAEAVSHRVPRSVMIDALKKAGARVIYSDYALDDTVLEGAYQAFVRGAGYAERERAENLIAVPRDPEGRSPQAIAYRSERAARQVVLALIDRFPELLASGQASAEIRVFDNLPPTTLALGGWTAYRLAGDQVRFDFAHGSYILRMQMHGSATSGSLRHLWEEMLVALADH